MKIQSAMNAFDIDGADEALRELDRLQIPEEISEACTTPMCWKTRNRVGCQ